MGKKIELLKRLEALAMSFVMDESQARKIAKLIMNLISDSEMIYVKNAGTEVNVVGLINGRPDAPESVDEIYLLVNQFTLSMDAIKTIFKALDRGEEFQCLTSSLEVLQEKQAAIYVEEQVQLEAAARRPHR